MMKKLLTVTLLLAAALGLQAKVYNVRDFGAAGDGVKIDSPAINAAIEAAAAKRAYAPGSRAAHPQGESNQQHLL